MNPEGLSLAQAPPLAIPASFFVTVPVAVTAAGIVLLIGAPALVSPFHRATLVLTHLGTLGVLAMAMFGALVQMLPVVAGSPVPLSRLAHGVHLLLVAGVGLGAAGLWAPSVPLTIGSGIALTLAIALFAGPVGLALLRAPTVDATVWGMRLAGVCLVGAGVLGLWMGRGHAGGPLPGPRAAWIQLHLTLGLLGWVGTLLMAVSWKVLPMFYLTDEVDPRQARAAVVLVALGLVATVAAFVAGASPEIRLGVSTPAAVVVWVAHPATTLVALARRRRKRTDGTLWFWRAGMGCGLLCLPLAVAAILLSSPVWALLFGWFAIWGWAGMVVHGMLCRIVPFLVWFHRLSPLVGIVAVPPVRRILPDSMVRRGFWLHLASVGLGAAAITAGGDGPTRLCGLALVAVGLSLGFSLFTVLRVKAPAMA